MDKRSVGSFIAALRRAKGMTQKDLAALLHVSDKTVSRWETGEGAPELALIPAIAEIFGVSCDELLRGERKSEADAAESTPLGEKRRKWLLDSVLRRFNIYCIIISGASLTAVAAGLILLFVPVYTHRQIVVTSVICAAVCAAGAIALLVGFIQAMSALGDMEDDGSAARYRQRIVLRGEVLLSLLAAAITALVAFALTLDVKSLIVGSAVALAAAALMFLAVNGYLQSRDFFGKRE